MDICLVTAATIAEFGDPEEISSESVRRAACEPQLGILSLAAILETSRHRPRIVNLNRSYLDYSEAVGTSEGHLFAEVAARSIASIDADVFGFSSICSSYPLTIRITRALKALRPKSTILLGGPQASVVDLQTLAAFPFVDLVLRGEAEQTLPLTLDQLAGERRFEQVPGLSYRVRERPQRNANPPVIQDLNALPTPAYHLTRDLEGAARAALELGRGCPFACTFCSTNDFFRRNFRLRSPERVLCDMRMIAANYSIRDFELVHDMFTVDRRRVAAFCQAMIASGEDFTWSCSARTDCIDEELLELMARGGCRGIFFGVEVGSEKMQNSIDKHLDPKRAEEIIDAAERLGIRSTVALITGFPDETWEDLRATMRVFMHSARCPKSHPQLNLLAPLAETPIYSKHKNELVLEELCSSMSQQARRANDADLELIRIHREIFPNFYIVPTPHLDRSLLVELREFVLTATARLRWILNALDQNTGGILDFFLEWRQHRIRLRPELKGSELRHYYRIDEFGNDFLGFVRAHNVGRTLAVRALLDYENVLTRSVRTDPRTKPIGESVPLGAALRRSDIPAREWRVIVFELAFDIQRIVDALQNGSTPILVPGPHFYVTREVSRSIDRVDRISDWMAWLLRLCDGRRNIAEIVSKLSSHLSEKEKPFHEYICMRLLAAAQDKKLINLYRVNSAGNHDGIGSVVNTRGRGRPRRIRLPN
jgi:radical SAM superfamily enzyme YgiQ (UPF0313 family)